jgi:CheY-like chemotaxis protein/GAF domain-containing protein
MTPVADATAIMELDNPRSVNDFDTEEGLLMALKNTGLKANFHDVARDFPKPRILPLDESDSMSEASFEPNDQLDWVISNYNAELSETQSLEEELKRLQVLKSYLILDSEKEGNFERLTALASRMFKVPICLVSLVDLGRQWFMSNRGLGDVKETPRKLAFCAHAIISKEDLLIIPDATKDARFKDNPLVTGPPFIRFYGGAPLICPEGYKLGTLCLIDSNTRPEGMSLEDKQNLRELAALVMDAMVERRRDKHRMLQDKSQIIATTAHDLLTPLSGVQMSHSLLLEDEDLQSRLTENQKELIATASACSEVMNRICHSAIETFRGEVSWHIKYSGNRKESNNPTGPKPVVISELVKNLNMVMEPYPKQVPLFITVDSMVPTEIISDDLKIFRSALNFLTNACKKTISGSVHLKIFVSGKRKFPKIVFECEDTGPGVNPEQYQFLFRPFRDTDATDAEQCFIVEDNGQVKAGTCHATMENSGLGLFSVANQISSIGGEYGFRPREHQAEGGKNQTGAIFWFSVPLILPKKAQPPVAPAPTTTSNGISGGDATSQKIRVLSTKNIDEDEAKRVFITVSQVLAEEKRKATSISDQGASVRPRRALVIDDSVVIRKSLSKALSRLGFEVTQAVNGLEGLKQLQSQVFDVVMCDYLMPVMDGLDCVTQYREWEGTHRPWFKQYIVGISAHASPNDVEKGKNAGMNDFKPKPVTMKILKELETSDELNQISKELDRVLTMKDTMEEEIPSEKKLKTDGTDALQMSSGPVCLIAEDSSAAVSANMKTEIERAGWQAVFVNDGEDALRLLKMRNWDAVMLDEEMSRLNGARCLARFREWEKDNRVARQNHLYLMSTSCVPSPGGATTTAAFPAGFDGALGKPVLLRDLDKVLDLAASEMRECLDSKDILSR